MDWILFGHTALWLGILSWFDIRKREIPHAFWVVIPLILTGGYRVWRGDWELVLLAAVISTVSERERLSQFLRTASLGRFYAWFPAIFFAAALSIPAAPISALAIMAFWAAWELRFWGGADAVTAIIIMLLWPGGTFILALLAAHLAVAIGMSLLTLIRERKIVFHRVPGLPILLVSTFLIPLGDYLHF